MRYLFRIGFALALGLALMAGCSDENGEGGSGGSAGTGGMAGEGGGGSGGMTGQEFPCTEQGIRDAIALGGGPHTFACDGPTTVVTEAEIVIDNNVILDGEGNLTVDGNEDHRVFSVACCFAAELRGFAVSGGKVAGIPQVNYPGGGGILNEGALTLTNSMVSDNWSTKYGGGISNMERGWLTVTNTTVSGNLAGDVGVAGLAGGIYNVGILMLTSSTVSGNRPEAIVNAHTAIVTSSTVSGNYNSGIANYGTLMLTSSTVSGNSGSEIYIDRESTAMLTNSSLIDGSCYVDTPYVQPPEFVLSNGHNIESPGDTCGFDQDTDQVEVTAEQLNLGPLQDNGGPTMTHALLPGSVAIDWIPEADCVDADGQPLTTDQRGEPRPETGGSMCDVGAFEVQP